MLWIYALVLATSLYLSLDMKKQCGACRLVITAAHVDIVPNHEPDPVLANYQCLIEAHTP